MSRVPAPLIRVLDPAPSRLLATLSDVKEVLKVSGSGDDQVITRILQRASGAIEAAVGRPLVRQHYLEAVPAWGKGRVRTSRFPIAGTPTARRMVDPFEDFDKAASALEEIQDLYVRDRAAGTLETAEGIVGTSRFLQDLGEPQLLPGSALPLIRIDYWAGWHPPATLSAQAAEFAAADSSITLASSTWSDFVRPGDEVEISGTDSNDGRQTVATKAGVKITVYGTIANESAASAVFDFRDLPEDLEEACLTLCRRAWRGRGRDPELASKKVGDLSLSWRTPGADGSRRGLPAEVDEVVSAYADVV